MTINIDERILQPAFNTLQRKILRNLAEVTSTETINDIVTDPSVIQLQLDDLTDVSASSPVAGDRFEFDGTDWVANPKYNLLNISNTGYAVETDTVFEDTVIRFTGAPVGDLPVEFERSDPPGTLRPVTITLINDTSTAQDLLVSGNGVDIFAAGGTGAFTVPPLGTAVLRWAGSNDFFATGDIVW